MGSLITGAAVLLRARAGADFPAGLVAVGEPDAAAPFGAGFFPELEGFDLGAMICPPGSKGKEKLEEK